MSAIRDVWACRHETLVDGDPQDLGACVNVDQRCSICGDVITTVSGTTEAWRARQDGQTVQRRLFA